MNSPEMCDELAAMASDLWAAADTITASGRACAGTLRERARPDDQLLSAWLAVNGIREWRGDTHWAIQLVDDMGDVAAQLLDGAARNPVTDGLVNAAGTARKAALEARLDVLSSPAWRALGADATKRFIDLVEPIRRADYCHGRSQLDASSKTTQHSTTTFGRSS